jgi:hypothetical protein
MLNKIKNGGCILAPIQPTDAIYEQIFAGEVQEPINWEMFLPLFETQKNTTGCVSFSRLNCAETLAKREGLSFNLSDRHLFVLSGTTKSGNNLNAVSEAFRTLGIVREEYFTWKEGQLEDPSGHWQEIFDTSLIPADARRYFGGNHSWVNGKENMKSALAFSPLQIAIGVGETYGDDLIKNPKEITAYHCIMLYYISDKGYHIYDSVIKATQILAPDYKILQAKSFRDLPEDWKLAKQQEVQTSLQKLVDLLKRIMQMLGLMKNEKEKAIEIIQEVIDEVKPEIPLPPPKYLWDMPVNIRHSIRIIGDEFKMTWTMKDLLCDICQCESAFNPKARRVNSPKSIDRGLFQWNSHWWPQITDEMAFNPETATRLACKAILDGKAKIYWSASQKCWNKTGKYNNLV